MGISSIRRRAEKLLLRLPSAPTVAPETARREDEEAMRMLAYVAEVKRLAAEHPTAIDVKAELLGEEG